MVEQPVLRHIRTMTLNEHPYLNLVDQVALLTVGRFGRKAYAYGFDDEDQARYASIRRFAVVNGYQVVETRILPTQWPEGVPVAPRIRRAFEQLWSSQPQRKVLWLFSEKRLRSRMKRAMKSGERIGLLLGYPKCCVKAYTRRQVEEIEQGMWAMQEQHSPATEDAFIELILSDPPLPPVEVHSITDRLMTGQLTNFPFVSHIPCLPCVEGSSQATARLNSRIEALAEELDASLATEIRRAATILAKRAKNRI